MLFATQMSPLLNLFQSSYLDGYTYTAEKPMKVATLSLGYADGIPRQLSNQGAYAIVNRQKASFLGRISMDLITIDITDIGNVTMHDWVTVIGNSDQAMTIGNLAEKAQIETREVLINLGNRFDKIYTL